MSECDPGAELPGKKQVDKLRKLLKWPFDMHREQVK